MQANWQTAKNILAIRLDSIGDVLMTTPAIRALKNAVPGRRITMLTSPNGAEVARLVPEIDDVIVYDAPWLKATTPRANSIPDSVMIQRLRRFNFDGAVMFTVFSQNPLPSAMLCYLADIPLRLAHCHENPYQLLTDWVPDPEPAQGIRHEVQRQVDLVAAIGCTSPDTRLSLCLPQSVELRAYELLKHAGVDVERPWAVIHPGATAPSRRYSPEGYAQVAHELAMRGVQIILTGAKSENDLLATIQQQTHAPTISLGGQLSLAELAAVIELAPLLITNNTGPAHIAAAVGTPVVVLYALTNPQHTPWGVPHRVLSHDVPCKNCFKSICPMGHHDCLRLVTPQDILSAVDELWDAREMVQPSFAMPVNAVG